jgi:hypothetical protein
VSKQRLEVWERIGFRKGEAVTWERSYDKGKTWQDVNWPGEKLPFVVLNPTEGLAWVIEVRRLDEKMDIVRYEPERAAGRSGSGVDSA